MMYSGFERLAGGWQPTVIVAAMLLAAATLEVAAAPAAPAPAPAAAAAAPAAPAIAPVAAAPAGGTPLWTKTCEQNPTTKQPVCNTGQEIWLNNDGSVRASFGIQLRPDKKYSIAGFVPLGFIIPAAVQITIDGDKKGIAQFMQCNPPLQSVPPGCFVAGEVDDDFIAAMRKGTKMALVVTNNANQQLPIELSLNGFGKAFDGDGMDPQAAAREAIQKSKEFQDAAKAAAQRMIDKQRQDTPAPAN
jgi:invasion protein IalB